MGHNRLGTLRKTHRWREVIRLLDATPNDTEAIAAASVLGAEAKLRRLANDDAASYPLWLLTRITWAARGDHFNDELTSLGIAPSSNSSALSLIARVGDRVRDELSSQRSRDHYGDIAALSLRQALTETVGREGPSLFGSSSDDLQRAVRAYSTRDRFGELARRYFAAFMSRTLRGYVEREIANHVGSGRGYTDLASAREFVDALDQHVWQSAAIVEDFAGRWYSKHNWESKGDVTPKETQHFLRVALRKLRTELRIGARA